MVRIKRWSLVGIIWVSAATFCAGQYDTQAISLSNGWNAIYLEVEPDDSRCSSVFDGWPVTSVSLYSMEQTYIQYTENPNEPLRSANEYLTWIAGHPEGANTLNAVLAGQAYLMYATNSFQQVITGRPAVPRIEWIPDTNSVNLVGFRSKSAAIFGKFLSGADFDSAKLKIFTVSGLETNAPTLTQVGGFTGSINQAPINQGSAYYIASDKVSSFSGPLKVFPAGTGGLYFFSDNSFDSLRMKNQHSDVLTVSLNTQDSKRAPSGQLPHFPVLHYFDYLNGWTPLTNTIEKLLQPGEEWTLPLAIDRSVMIEGELYGGLLVCSDSAGGEVVVPLEVEYGSPDPIRALWPAGLWVGKAVLTSVSQVLDDNTITNGVEAGTPMELRLIMHVDENKVCRLLQRAIIAGEEDTDGYWTPSIYTSETNVPPNATAIRISSVAFSLNNDMSWDEEFGNFGDRVAFGYTISTSDTVNPFRHPYHPDHDGLDSTFKNRLPSGDDLDNYIGEIKPELFSISNTVSLVWDEATTHSSSSAFWNPTETVTGEITFEVEGIRREGVISMGGRFRLQRISQIGTLSE